MARASWSTGRIAFAVLILVGLTIARLVPTYTTFTQTYDEPSHVMCGMAWLEWSSYEECVDHPPLARVALALGAYLKGIRTLPAEDDEDPGNPILYSGGQYFQNLTRARLGNLPFLVLACVVVFLWSNRWFSTGAGLWAVLLFVNLPPILGHAGLATLDIACTATVLAALYMWMRWLEAPGWGFATGFSLALAVALLTKFSSLPFLAVCCAGSLVWVVFVERSVAFTTTTFRSWMPQGSVVAAITLVVFWAGYRFDLHPIARARGVVDFPLPFTEAAHGLWQLYLFNQDGDWGYLFGSVSQTGWWGFFPVAVAVKTPIGFLVLAAAGLVVPLLRKRPWQVWMTAAFPIAILLVCMASRINLGLRHALAIYPFLAILAGPLVVTGLLSRRRLMVGATALLVGWVVIDAWKAHPDYMADFNELAGTRPEQILSESDLDWGQDLQRLSRRLEALGVEDVAIAYFGTARLQEAGLPRYRVLGPTGTATGYVAVSVRLLTLEYAANGSYAWLRRLTPIERIGKSIDLFFVAEQPGPSRHEAPVK